MAAALQARWRIAVIQSRSIGIATPTAPPKPFAGYGAKAFLSLVRDFEKVLVGCLHEVPSSVRRAVAVKTVIMGFTDYQQIAGTDAEDVQEFFPSPVLKSAFLQFVQYADRTREAKRKRQAQVLEVQESPCVAFLFK